MTLADRYLIEEYDRFCNENNIKIRSVGMAQAMIESSHATSELYIDDSNCFGIKYTERADYKAIYNTREYVNGEYITISDEFSGFNDLDNCFRDYVHIVNPSEFSNIDDYLNHLCELGYATSPDYIQLIRDVIRDFELEQYDKLTTTPENHDVTILDFYITAYENYKIQLDRMANAVIRGDYGNGDDRRDILGVYYDAIQTRVDEILKGWKNEFK